VTPDVSVVMSVYNGARYLPAALKSVLDQRDVSLEVIAVDDGCTDESPSILERCASGDARLRVLRQENQGLTRALRRACGEARGEYVARHDADDLSEPDRLQRQVAHMAANPDAVLATCWASLVGPEDEVLDLWEPRADPEDLREGIHAPTVSAVRNIIHGTALFRRSAYAAVDGYRPEFALAQDIDLWLRLTERGSMVCVPNVLYRRRVTPGSLSARFGREQVELARIALELARARASGMPEAALLAQAARVAPPARGGRPRQEAQGLYFIGKCLLDRRDARAGAYFREVLRRDPLHLKAWLALGATLLRR
jgi:glycosyltransferase involved in cell wall biosynthesis